MFRIIFVLCLTDRMIDHDDHLQAEPPGFHTSLRSPPVNVSLRSSINTPEYDCRERVSGATTYSGKFMEKHKPVEATAHHRTRLSRTCQVHETPTTQVSFPASPTPVLSNYLFQFNPVRSPCSAAKVRSENRSTAGPIEDPDVAANITTTQKLRIVS